MWTLGIKEVKEEISLEGMPKLWSDVPVDHCPPALDPCIDRIFDCVELSRRCKMNVLVVFNAEVEDVMFKDLSSGRQLAMRQGTEKVKTFVGKILWIQNCGVELSQIQQFGMGVTVAASLLVFSEFIFSCMS